MKVTMDVKDVFRKGNIISRIGYPEAISFARVGIGLVGQFVLDNMVLVR